MKIFLSLVATTLLIGSTGYVHGQAATTLHPERVVGSQSCADCHEEEVKAWRLSSHFRSDSVHRDVRTREKADQIAKAMGLDNGAAMTSSPLCTECHFTQQKIDDTIRTVGGVSCESCHGAAKEYLTVHGDRENIADREERQKLAKAAGMLYPHDTVVVAQNCYNCHIVRDEDLVNVGGHPARSAGFNLVSWTQGEVRHNFYNEDYTRNPHENMATSQPRQRKMFVVGMLLDLEYSLRGLSTGRTAGGAYRNAMGTRSHTIINRELPAVIARLGGDDAPSELLQIREIAAGIQLTGDPALVGQAAEEISALIVAFSDSHDGSTLEGIDEILPKTPRGTAWQP